MYNLNNLGKKIADARKAHGLTQEQLAKELSVTAQAVSKWELGVGYPDISIIPHIAQVLRIPIDRLFGYCDGFEENYQGLPFVTSYRGVACYSDKEVDSIGSDGIVFFTDGSAANLIGKTVDNYGNGEIRFLVRDERGPTGKPGQGEVERTFNGVDSFLIDLYSTDVIRFIKSDDDTTLITATGESEFISSLSISAAGRRVFIRQDGRRPRGETGEAGVIEIRTRGVYQTLTLDVHRQTECTSECDFREVGMTVYEWADVSLSQTGWLGLSVKGECNFVCKGADKADLWLHNSSTVEIEEVGGNVHLETRGENNVTIERGTIRELYTAMRGSGSLSAEGLSVGRAEMRANGTFDITLGAIRKSSFEALHGDVNLTVLKRGEG